MKIWIFLDIRSRVGSPFKAVKFTGSPHVGHLRYNKQKYTEEVTAFINDGTIKRKMEWKQCRQCPVNSQYVATTK